MVRMHFGRLHCYYRQPKITQAQFAYLAIYLVLIDGDPTEPGGRLSTFRTFFGNWSHLRNSETVRVRRLFRFNGVAKTSNRLHHHGAALPLGMKKDGRSRHRGILR